MQKNHLFLLLLIMGTSFWGISFVFVKIGIEETNPFVFLFYKFLIAAVTLSIVFARQLKYLSRSIFFSGFLLAIPLLLGTAFQTIGLKYTTVSNSAFITGLDVLLIPIIKLLLFKKMVRSKIWISCLLALSGLYIIAVKEGLSLNIGDLWTVAGAFGFAAYVLMVGKYARQQFPLLTVIITMFVCGTGCFLLSFSNSEAVWFPSNNQFWWGVLFAGIPATAYMYSIQNMGQQYLEEEKIALAYLFEPIFATIAGVYFLQEEFGIRTIIGGLLIIAAMLIAEVDINQLVSKISRRKLFSLIRKKA